MTVEVASQVKKRQKRSVEEKRRIVEETLAAGASVACVVSLPITSFGYVRLAKKRRQQPELDGLGCEPVQQTRQRHKQNKRTRCLGRGSPKSGACSGGNAFVAMMESANLWDLHNPTHRRRLNRTADWRVLA